MRAMRLTVRRKTRRRGQSIAVGAESQSCPRVGCIGKVASGYIGQRNSTVIAKRKRKRELRTGAKSCRSVCEVVSGADIFQLERL